MDIKELIKNTRSRRRFYQDKPIHITTLRELIDLARLGSSARNAQPLKYVIVNSPDMNDKVFSYLAWAGALKDWPGPEEGERPAAYIVMLGDTQVADKFYCDHGIAAQNILLGATEKKLGGCVVASIDRRGLTTALNIPEHCEILQIVALGVPKEKVVLEDMHDNNFNYWRDENGVHHVPKRQLEEIIIGEF